MSDHFNVNSDLVYLNHAAVSPWPVAASDAVIEFARENADQGAADYPRWLQIEAELRVKLRQLINAPSVDDVALLKSTSEGLSFVAHGLEWHKGDNIVIPAGEFPSNRMVWQSLQRYGVELRQVEIDGIENPEQALIDAMDANTRLLACSSVQYTSGLRLDLQVIGAACRQAEVLFCVDAIQSLGAIRFDLEKIGADFIVADGHKWMTGPEGLALFYCAEPQREKLRLHEFGWHMMENPHDFSQQQWQPANSAQRFECGSPNMLGAVALDTSLGVLFDTGMDSVEQRVLDNTAYLISLLQPMQNIRILTPLDDARRAGIVLFECIGHDQAQVYQQLMQQNIICAARGAGVRFSPHFYTTRQQLEHAVETLQSILDR